MKRNCTIISVLICMLIVIWGCNSEEWDAMPVSIQKFVAQYYPGSVIESYYNDDSGYHVEIQNGASLTFSSPTEWQSINGNGVTLPKLFIENEMPDMLYRYLLEMESVGGVYIVTRDARVYNLKMFDTDLVYNISTGKVSYTQ